MAWSSDHRRGPFALGLASIVALWFGCFDGAGALGYPCASDDDCGPSLACEDTGCCGGDCLFGPATTGDSTTTTATTGDSTTSSSTIDPTTEGPSESSGSTGAPDPVCGNGAVEEGEECDLGEGEDGNGEWEPCTLECRNAILHFTAAEEGGDDFCDAVEVCDPLWQRVDRTTGPWGSGPYGLEPTVYRLVSREFVIPEPEMLTHRPQVEIRHEFRFDVCETTPGVPEYYDAAHVMLWNTETGEHSRLSPQALDLYSAPPSCMFSNTPWCLGGRPPTRVFVGSSMGPKTARRATIPQELIGVPLRLVFEIAFDFDNCQAGIASTPHPWQLHRVVVALAPPLG